MIARQLDSAAPTRDGLVNRQVTQGCLNPQSLYITGRDLQREHDVRSANDQRFIMRLWAPGSEPVNAYGHEQCVAGG